MDLKSLRDNYRDDIISIISVHHGENVRIFGSVVRGEAGEESDIDILIHPQRECSLLDICAMERKVSSLLGGKKVDILPDTGIRDELAPYVLGEAQEL